MKTVKIVSIAIAQALISCLLFYASTFLFAHGSSYAFELGGVLVVIGIFHWAFWPSYGQMTND